LKILFGLFCVTVLLFSQISIKSAWQNIERQNDALKASHADVRHSQLKQESAEGMYLPSVSITGSYTHLNNPISLDTSEVSGMLGSLPIPIPFPTEIDFLDQDISLIDLQVLYPLYMGGKIDAAQDAFTGKVLEAKARHRMEKDKAFLQLVKLYYGVIMTQSLYKTRLESQKALKLHYNHAKRLKNEGQISRVEVLNAQVKLDIAKIETTKALHKVDIVTSAFHKMIKSNNNPKSSLFILNKIGSKYKYMHKSTKNYAAIDVLNAKSKQATAMIKIEEASWHPKVLGYANVNLHKGNSPLEEMTPEWMVGVGIKFDLFSRKDRAKEIEAAKVLQSKVASLKTQAQDDLQLAVQKTYNEILLYTDEFNSLSSSLALAYENYKLRNLAFKEGLATSVEVVDAQMLLSGAKTQRLNAAYNYIKKLAELSVLTGDNNLFFEFEKSGKKIK
jgi:outer membrane protein TolC